MLKSIVSLIAGFAIMTFASVLGTLLAAMAFGVQGDPPYSAAFNYAMIGVTVVAAGLGGYATASLAPGRKAGHAVVLALMILIMQSYNVISPQEGYPRAHFIWLLVLCPLAAIAGGQLREIQLRRRVKNP
jgi:hypothetical protein